MSRPEEYLVFLASSQELAADRQAFAELMRRRNDDWVGRGVHLRLVIWEDFIDAMSKTRLQQEYNAAIKGCALFVMLFHTKVGPYTEEEFNTAFGQFQATGKPFIYTYFKTAAVDLDSIEPGDLASRKAFQARLNQLGHFQTRYENIQGLLLHFWQQLDKLVANGFIRFPAEADPGTGLRFEATLTGDGAIAQGDHATALGAGAVQIKGKVTGTVNTGTITSPNDRRPI